MSGWYGSMDMGGLGRIVDDIPNGMTDPQSTVITTTSNGGSSMRSVAKKAGYGLVAGAVIGMVLLRVPMYSKMMTKDKSWQAAAIGAAVAVPLASMYA